LRNGDPTMQLTRGRVALKSILTSVPTVTWILAAMVLFFARTEPTFLTLSNAANLLRQGAVLLILCMGVIVVKIAGGIELSVGGVLTLAGMLMAWSLVYWHVPLFVSVLIALAVGTICGVLNGIFVTRMQVPSFIATLGMQGMSIGLSLAMNKGSVVWGMPKTADWFGNGILLGLPVPMLLFLLTFVLTFVLLGWTPFGVYVYALGGNEAALKLAGRPSWWYRVLTFTYAGLMAGLAGVIMTSRTMAAQPTVGQGMEFEAFSAVVLGGSVVAGRGTAIGALLGALFILILRNGLNVMGVATYYQLAIIGVVLISAIVLSVLLDRRLHG